MNAKLTNELDALYHMANNAREFGLEYCKHGSDSACKECYMENVEQEPVYIVGQGWQVDKELQVETTLYTRPTKPLSDDDKWYGNRDWE